MEPVVLGSNLGLLLLWQETMFLCLAQWTMELLENKQMIQSRQMRLLELLYTVMSLGHGVD